MNTDKFAKIGFVIQMVLVSVISPLVMTLYIQPLLGVGIIIGSGGILSIIFIYFLNKEIKNPGVIK